MPCFTTALSFYDGYRHEMLPANLIQVSFRVGGEHPPGWCPEFRACLCPNQPVPCSPGSARLLWGTHLRTRGQAGPIHPHQLDGPRGQRVLVVVQCLMGFCSKPQLHRPGHSICHTALLTWPSALLSAQIF